MKKTIISLGILVLLIVSSVYFTIFHNVFAKKVVYEMHDVSFLHETESTGIIPSEASEILKVPSKQSSTTAISIPKKNYSPLIKNIRTYLSQFEGTYGLYFINLTSGQAFGLNDKESFTAASTIKLPVNLYLYKLAAEKKINLNQLLTYTEDFYEEGTGSIQYDEFGTEYSLKELSMQSIIISDNVAINMLIGSLGFENIKAYMENIIKHEYVIETNQSTPKDMALYLKALVSFSNKNNTYGPELLSYFKNTIHNDRIPRYLPEGIECAHKIGSQLGVVNDVGIVYGDHPFIIAIMSKNVNEDEDEAPEVIGQTVKMIYDFEETL